MAAILDALPLDQSDFFLVHAGSLDIPKLTLLAIENPGDDSVRLKLGTAAFKEFFFSHHFADYMLSRSSSNDMGGKATLRTLFAPITLDLLADDEFKDEFMSARPGEILIEQGVSGKPKHELVGICANSPCLFQPELLILTTITVDNEALIDKLLLEFAPGKGNQFWAIESLDALPEQLSKTRSKLRPLCQTALDVIYYPLLTSKTKRATQI